MTDWEVQLEERVLEGVGRTDQTRREESVQRSSRGQRGLAGQEVRPDSGQGTRNTAGGIPAHVDATAPKHQGPSQGGY